MSTSAINGKIFFKQGDRAYLDANKRSNSLVFDLTNNYILYSPSGTNYYEFPSGRISAASTSTSGFLTSSDWNKFNLKADVSASSSAYYFQNPDPTIVVFNGNVSSASVQNVSSAPEFPYWTVGYRAKKFTVSGPSSGSYQATIVFKGTVHSDISWDVNNDISATISNSSPTASAFYTNKLTKWSGNLTIDSGTIPSPGISAIVEV